MLMKPFDTNTLGGRVAIARKGRNLTQAELAKLAGITQSSVALLESGSSKTSHNAVALAEALQVPVEWLLSGAGFENASAPGVHEVDSEGQDESYENMALATNKALDSFAARLTFRREQCGFTQAQLAAKSGLSQATIGNLETGRNKGTKKILELAKALHITPEWLIHGGNLSQAQATVVRKDFGILSAEEQSDHEIKRLLGMADDMPKIEGATEQKSARSTAQPVQMLPIIAWFDKALTTPHATYLSHVAEGHFRTSFQHGPLAFFMRVSFDVMAPEYQENDLILVDPEVSPQNTDDIVILDANGQPGFGRLRQTLSGRYLETLNPQYPDRLHRMDDDALIVGTVTALFRQRRAKA